jgi:peptidoglycan/LPS O-acetylase OafA/YrhL
MTAQKPTPLVSSPALPYRPDIDGLRAVAVLLVLVFHFQLLPLGQAGFIGVDVFFVISGFLITSIISQQLDEGSFQLGAFYIARIRRLAPALTVVILLSLLYGWLRLTSHELLELGYQAAAAQFYVSNVYYWRNVGYFGIGADTVYLLHTWSLAVEEQFYLLFPLALLLVHRHLRHRLWHLLALAAVASFALNIAWVVGKPLNTFYLLPTRAWELLAGALLVVCPRGFSLRGVNDGLGLAALLLLLMACLGYRTGTPVPGWFALMPVTAAAALIVAGADTRSFTHRVLAARPLVYLGRISYCVYLLHWPLHVFAQRELGLNYDLPMRVTAFGAAIVFAALISRFIEQPVRARVWLASARRLMTGYAAALGITAALCLLLWSGQGLPNRLPARAARYDAYSADRPPPMLACRFSPNMQLPPQQDCHIGAATAAPRWLILGDSHAWAGHAAFDRWLRQRGEGGWLIYLDQCPPLSAIHLVNDPKDACGRFNTAAYDWLERTPSLVAVVLVSAWSEIPEGLIATAVGEQRADATRAFKLFDEQFDASLARLKAAGKTVHVWAPVPGGRAHVPRDKALAIWQDRPVELEWTRAEHQSQFAFFYRAAQRCSGLIDHLISPAQSLCASGLCSVLEADAPLYFDNSHLATSQAEFWATLIAKGQPMQEVR